MATTTILYDLTQSQHVNIELPGILVQVVYHLLPLGGHNYTLSLCRLKLGPQHTDFLYRFPQMDKQLHVL